ncbi:MAG: SUMF1/EgtB/PvdO family nonheme iron enzyme [Bacteroidales bacterium]|nr:SUMF1/EgtB/PvdO family nonheme iron enzyme [Bacteroidales bacterium]MBQ9313022.1 SUMF1/EgtB/PvdO family nonheme iron enzyme [Bacteroidales bacterium]
MRKNSLFVLLLVFAYTLAAQNFVRVEGGYFQMGCNSTDKDCYPDEQPSHKVKINTFEIGKYEVTVKEYREFCKATGRTMPREPQFGWQDNYPIVNVSWQDAFDYAKWKGCRLPTEAEWEYAAKGGKKSKGYIYSGSDDYEQVAWCYENSEKTLHPVGEKQPNELGLYDMSGNAWEWCADNYEIFYYETSPSDNPKGPKQGLGKVNRGGCFAFDHSLLNVHHRRCSDAESIGTGTGFRIARDVK